jgi:branched-chain amino acid transport system ATP-binding protein
MAATKSWLRRAEQRAATSLRVSGVSVAYKGVMALAEVSIELTVGEVVGLIGPNGAGKTTLLNAISGFTRISSGQVHVDDRLATNLSPQVLSRYGIVRTFQQVATFPDLTVRENIELGALVAGHSRRRARAVAAHLARELALSDDLDQRASALPHGDERRLGIARGLAAEPRLLLLDEPAAGLNDRESDDLAEMLRSVVPEYGCGILIVEHDMHMIFGICDRVHVLNFGRTLVSGEPKDVLADPSVVEAYLGTHAANIARGALSDA